MHFSFLCKTETSECFKCKLGTPRFQDIQMSFKVIKKKIYWYLTTLLTLKKLRLETPLSKN